MSLFIKNFPIAKKLPRPRRGSFYILFDYDFFAVIVERERRTILGRARNDIARYRRFDMRLNKPL